MKVVIVGGVAGGATAAARIRRLDEKAEIIIFERTGFISYANCGLPYFIGDIITDPDDLTLQSPQGFFRRFRIVAKVYHEVISINIDRKTVTVKNLETGETFEETYDKLLLSPGAKPILPKMDGEMQNVFSLRSVEDTFRIKSYIQKNQPKTAILAGGGFISLELAENLRNLGIDVTIVQSGNQLMAPFDVEMSAFIHNELRRQGVKLVFGNKVERITSKNGATVVLDSGCSLQADMVIVAIGVIPDTNLAKKAGLELGLKESIVVNDKMETSIKDVYAVGDAIQVKNFITEQDDLIALAGPANKQGRIAADNICGLDNHYNGSQGSSVIKVFELTAATTGISEKKARLAGLMTDSIILSPASHAGYYPGAMIMTMKVVFEKDTYRILGAQIIGYDGVDKRIDVIATTIRAGIKANELKELDLAYAPPYSSAKDPVNMAGFIAENIKNGLVKQFTYEEIPSLRQRDDVILLDTRTPNEYARGCAKGFINIPLDSLRERLSELDTSKKIYVMCQSGLRSYLSTRILVQNGFDAYNFVGGYRLYASIKNEETLSKQCYSCGMDK